MAKNSIIIYGSRYGSTKRYAERLAEITGLQAVFFKDVKCVADYDRIVYLGALCAGGVMGLKKTVDHLSANQEPTRPMPKTSTTSGAASKSRFPHRITTKVKFSTFAAQSITASLA